MDDLIDLEAFPVHLPGSRRYRDLVERCRSALSRDGTFSLFGFLKPRVAEKAVAEIAPVMATASYLHKRRHNIYFKKAIGGLSSDHPALRQFETVNRTLCADQLSGSVVVRIYEYPPFVDFLAATMDKPRLYHMADPLARVNVMAYRDGETLNWHFDRSEFTTTLLLQAAQDGGAFEYRTDLRSDHDPNYEGVARLFEGKDPECRTLELSAGTLNVFRGKNTAHRVTTVRGDRERIIAVYSFYERPGVQFSDEERIGFYGRAA